MGFMGEPQHTIIREGSPDTPLSVLLVEDCDTDADFIRVYLDRLEAPSVILKRSVDLSGALEHLHRGGIDLVLLDLTLPDSRGYETFLKVSEAAPSQTIVVISGINDEDLALKALQQGAQDYIVKGQMDGTQLIRALRFAVERKRAESALRASEARFRSVVNNALDTIITFDATGTILTFNTAGEKTFGYRAEEVVGSNIQMLIPEVNAPEGEIYPDPSDNPAVLQVQSHLYEMTGRHKKGAVIPLEISIRKGVEGGECIYIVIARDITGRKQTEDNLRKAQQELTQANQLAVLGEMSAEVGHELNQPLEAIQAYIDNIFQLFREHRYEEARSNFEAICDLTRRAGKIIKNIKNLSGHNPLESKPVSLRSTLESSIRLLSAVRTLDDVELIKHFPAREVRVLAEHIKLEQVFVNLFDNALDAMEGHPVKKLIVKLHTHGKQAVLIIRDTGPGLPAAGCSQIFEPFFTTKGIQKGLGLGLSIASKFIHQCGGTIAATNHPQGGAQFTIEFPIYREVSKLTDG